MSRGGGFTRGCLATVFLTLALFSRLVLASAVTITKDAVVVDTVSTRASDVIGKLDELSNRRLDFTILDLGNKPVRFQATTGADGRLPLSVVPWSEWSPATASRDGALRVPDGTFGSVEVLRSPPGAQYGSDAREGVLNVVTRGAPMSGLDRTQFGVYQGKVLQPQRYFTELLSPFSNLCRSHEGPPRELATSGRLSYEVRDDATLRLVLGQSYVKQPYYFRLPEGGYHVTSAAGSGGTQYRGSLEGLLREGRIARLEVDPCWKFLPDGTSGTAACVSADLGWPEKAVRVRDSFGGTLLDPFTKAPVRDGFVLYAPLSPTPFFDPGDRPGDAQPPTWTPIGADGQYHVLVDTWNGPFETTVASGCDEHTTVAIAEGPTSATAAGGTTVVRTPPPGTPVPASTTRTTPLPEERVCGPDITDMVMRTLEFMIRTFDAWAESTKTSKCVSLLSPKADGAWEMRNMGPSDSDRGKDKYLWFGRYLPDVCARPKWPCGATAQFLGACLDAQIVNYVQWGAANELCDNQDIGVAAHIVRDVALNALGGSLGHRPAFHAQNLMSQVGGAFAKLYGTRGFPDRRKTLDAVMKWGLEKWPDIAKTVGFDCPLTCGKYEPDPHALDGKAWGFKWGFDGGSDRYGNDTGGGWYDMPPPAAKKP